MIVILMGVMGAGKTTVGRLLAARLGWPFYDADDFHPPANIERLRYGLPLADIDRAPWLEALRRLIERLVYIKVSAVLACSALREQYRRALVPVGVSPEMVRFVYLCGEPALLAERLRGRTGHFAAANLLESQLALLEVPADAFTLDVTAPPEVLAECIANALQPP